ncbi:hypothetical protein COO04_31095 [Bacillus toyonensis]|nr:hypothetical protein COO04_31095 [Bacillus toyonensis]
MYLYFVADSEENTIDFYLSKSRYKQTLFRTFLNLT